MEKLEKSRLGTLDFIGFLELTKPEKSLSKPSKPWVGGSNPSRRTRKYKGFGVLPRLFLR